MPDGTDRGTSGEPPDPAREDAPEAAAAAEPAGADPDAGAPADAAADSDAPAGEAAGDPSAEPGSRRYPVVTRTTSRPQGGNRVAAGSSPAPFRQWPLLSVLGGAALGLLLLPLSFRAGLLVVGGALLGGAVLRMTLPTVGMLAVRSRFTDIVTYGVLGTTTVLLTLMAQPRPWLEVPFLNDVLRFSAGG